MSESRPVDDISKLHALTMSFSNQMRDIIGKSLIECTKLSNYDDISTDPQVQKVRKSSYYD